MYYTYCNLVSPELSSAVHMFRQHLSLVTLQLAIHSEFYGSYHYAMSMIKTLACAQHGTVYLPLSYISCENG